MTIEQKAKAYDEAVRKAEVYYNTTDDIGLQNWLSNVFPELKESEDEKNEKVRIGLIKAFNTVGKSEWGGLNMQDILAWLEKQGERQTPQNNERAWLYLVADVLTWREGIGQYLDNPKVQELAKKLQKEYGQKLYIEEQGNPTDINPSEFDLRLNKLLKQFETLPKEELVSSLSFYLNVVQNDGTYKDEEKQGEQKPANKVELKFHEGDTIVEKDLDECGYGTIKEIKDGQYIFTDGSGINIDEQDGWELLKTSTNVKSKFKVGDWILIDKPCQVKSIDNYGNYAIQYSDSDFMERYVLSKNFCESYFHLWTINDAKDGDVIATGNKNIFIFKSISDCTIYDYCGLYFEKFAGWPSSVNGIKAVKLPTDYVPATKEQYDTLMKAISDAGYTFDFEKKELKKL